MPCRGTVRKRPLPSPWRYADILQSLIVGVELLKQIRGRLHEREHAIILNELLTARPEEIATTPGHSRLMTATSILGASDYPCRTSIFFPRHHDCLRYVPQVLVDYERQKEAAAKIVRAAYRARRRRQEIWEQEFFGGYNLQTGRTHNSTSPKNFTNDDIEMAKYHGNRLDSLLVVPASRSPSCRSPVFSPARALRDRSESSPIAAPENIVGDSTGNSGDGSGGGESGDGTTLAPSAPTESCIDAGGEGLEGEDEPRPRQVSSTSAAVSLSKSNREGGKDPGGDGAKESGEISRALCCSSLTDEERARIKK